MKPLNRHVHIQPSLTRSGSKKMKNNCKERNQLTFDILKKTAEMYFVGYVIIV
jgi:hypothetical protein